MIILKQWIVLKACSNWLLKVQISFLIHLKGFAPKNIVIIFLCYNYYLTVLVYTKTPIHLIVGS